MKHGEVLVKYRWNYIRTGKIVTFRFRIDPVPGIHKNSWHFGQFYKKPRYRNERKQWYASEGYGRNKRNPYYLPNDWNDRVRSDVYNNRSWKKSRKVKKQWQKSR